MQQLGVISTNVARCRDCYRCVRACPVKAVRVKEGQAHVVPELCIACGSCVCACPQKPRTSGTTVPLSRRQSRPVGRSLPAWPLLPGFLQRDVLFPDRRDPQGLGFSAAEETAYGALMVGSHTGSLSSQGPMAGP